MKKALFRCDASTLIGSGHVVRCLTLADALKKEGWSCFFAVSAETPPVVPVLTDSGYAIMSPDTPKEHFNAVIFDHYGLSKTDEQAFRPYTDCILVIDDLADRPHDCDILMDQTHGRLSADYRPWLPPHTEILTGAQYALLRDQFHLVRAFSLERRKNAECKRLLVLISNTDPGNVTLKVIAAIKGSPVLSCLMVDIVLGQRAIDRMKISESIADMHNVTLHTDVRDMAAVMSSADLAIGAGGTASWERCCLGLPTIIIEIADNQKLISQNLHKAGAAINLGWHTDLSPEDIAESAIDLIKSPERMSLLSSNAANICDGLGAKRVAQTIINKTGTSP